MNSVKCSLWKVILIVGIYCVKYTTGNIYSGYETLPKGYTSYRRYPWCEPSDYMRYPQTAQDVVAIVQEAIYRRTTVKAFGARHSQTDIICTEGIPVDNHGLQGKVLHPDGIMATFGAGVTLHDATSFLRHRGRAFRTTPAFGNITLGGAIGTGAHGSSIKYTSSISQQVVSMTIVDGFGILRVISDEEDLHAFRVHLGLLGIVVDITLITVPLYKTLAFNYITSDQALTDGTAEMWARTADQISIYWFPAFEELVVANWTIVDVDTPGHAWTYDHVPSTHESFNVAMHKIMENVQGMANSPCPSVSSTGFVLLRSCESFLQSALVEDTPGMVPIYTEDGDNVAMPAVGYYDKMFAPTCKNVPDDDGLACPWSHGRLHANLTILDNEISVDLTLMPEFITAIKDILRKTPTPFPLQGILLRFSAGSGTYMSTSYGRDTVHFEFYQWNRRNIYETTSAGIAGYQTILQLLAKRFHGRSHFGKSGMVYHSKPMLELKLHPIAKAGFIAVMNKYDPNGVFMNNFGRRLTGIGDRMDLDPLITRCAIQDNCFCQSNQNCGPNQICSSIPGYEEYPVCKSIGERAEGRIEKHLLPSPYGFLNWINSVLPNFMRAVDITCLTRVDESSVMNFRLPSDVVTNLLR